MLRAVKPLGATSEQLAALTAAVETAHGRLAQQANTNLQTLAALRDPVTRARQQLLPLDVNLNDPQLSTALLADEQVTAAQRTDRAEPGAAARAAAWPPWPSNCRTLFTPAQVAVIEAQGRAMLVAQRAEQEQVRQQRQQQFQRAMAATGAPNGGPGAPNAGPGGRGRNGGFGGRGGGPGGPPAARGHAAPPRDSNARRRLESV